MDAASPFCAPGVQRRIFEFRRVPESHFRVQMKPFGWSGESPGSLRGESVDAQGRPELPGRFATNSNAGNLVNNGVGQRVQATIGAPHPKPGFCRELSEANKASYFGVLREWISKGPKLC